MKKLNLLCAAAVFSLVLSTPTFAGDIQTPTVTAPPPPVKPNAVSEPFSVPGDLGSTGLSQEQTELSSELLIEVLLGMLSLY